jgi:hypothetical protein
MEIKRFCRLAEIRISEINQNLKAGARRLNAASQNKTGALPRIPQKTAGIVANKILSVYK